MDTPADVFLELWVFVNAESAATRSRATQPCIGIARAARAALVCDDLSDVMRQLASLRQHQEFIESSLAASFVLMREIDRVFGLIHPRAVTVSPSHGARPKIPNWLQILKQKRLENGGYSRTAGHIALPRGPLRRKARDPNASNADSVADRFTYIGVAPVSVLENERQVRISVRTIGADIAGGARPGATPGAEVVAFVPIAEEHGDVILNHRDENGQLFVDCSVRIDLNCADRFVRAAERSGKIDIAIAPELVMSHEQVKLLPDLIRKSRSKGGEKARIFVAGSGATNLKVSGQAWNEGAVFNAAGRVLWTQRKIQQAGITSERAVQYGLPDPGQGRQIYEDNASGDELVVADVDGLGRCIVLICQDLEARPFSEDLIRAFQPDWIFVPILDPEVRPGGWSHRRALALSSASPGRFLIATSTALQRTKGSVGEACFGMAVGPQSEVDGDVGRRYAVVSSEHADSPRVAKVTWKSAEPHWQTSKVS